MLVTVDIIEPAARLCSDLKNAYYVKYCNPIYLNHRLFSIASTDLNSMTSKVLRDLSTA